jgi:hypothetical protein
MAINTTILIVVATVAALVLVGLIVAVTYKTRNQHRHVIDETLQDKAKHDAHIRHEEALADEYAATAHAAQVEVDVKTARADRLYREAVVQRREAVSCREELTP